MCVCVYECLYVCEYAYKNYLFTFNCFMAGCSSTGLSWLFGLCSNRLDFCGLLLSDAVKGFLRDGYIS